jgi:3-phenylpropionate/trans-cinnamate dioxygenase ferredoxin reductase subunit
MGFIGCEVAASLRAMGVAVVAVDTSPAPLFRVLGREVSEIVASIHRDHGVQGFFEEGVAAFEGDERVRGVVTTGGRRIECDFAVVGVGVEPEVDLLAGSGLDIDDGLIVDEYCRSASPDLYAAGDVASQYHPLSGGRFRVEHWQNAMQQGAAAARNMLGREQPYDPVHWFWSDQYDCNLQFAGLRHGADRLVVRGSLERRDFLGFYVREEHVDAIVALNRGKELRRAMPLVRSRQPVDAQRLQDEAVDVRSLVREGVRVSTGAGEQESIQEQESKRSQ